MYHLTFLNFRKKEFLVQCCATFSEVPTRCVCPSSDAFSWRNIQTFKQVLIGQLRNAIIFSRIVVFRGSYFIKAIENFFPVFTEPRINTLGVGRIFVSGLHDCLEVSQPLSCLCQAMQTQKTFSVA